MHYRREQAQQRPHLAFDIMIRHDRWHACPHSDGVPGSRRVWPAASGDYGRVWPAPRGVLDLAVAGQDLLIVCHDLGVMGLDVLDSGLDIVWKRRNKPAI